MAQYQLFLRDAAGKKTRGWNVRSKRLVAAKLHAERLIIENSATVADLTFIQEGDGVAGCPITTHLYRDGKWQKPLSWLNDEAELERLGV